MRFTVIAVDYEHHVPRDGMRRGLQSLANQTFADFELIIVHDGPKQVPYADEFDLTAFPRDPLLLSTAARMDDWGHSSRNLGLRFARGDYVLHFNIDNLLYPNCLETLAATIDETGSPIVIFAIRHHKIDGGAAPFTGVPPRVGRIDALQLVASREVWKATGYWHSMHAGGDGIVYEEMCAEHPWVAVDAVLGENF